MPTASAVKLHCRVLRPRFAFEPCPHSALPQTKGERVVKAYGKVYSRSSQIISKSKCTVNIQSGYNNNRQLLPASDPDCGSGLAVQYIILVYTISTLRRLASLQAPVLRRWSPRLCLILDCTSQLFLAPPSSTPCLACPLHHRPPAAALSVSPLSNLELLFSCWSRRSWLYLRHRGSSPPAHSRPCHLSKTADIR